MSKIRIRHGDNEIELDGSDPFIAKQLDTFYERLGSVATSSRTTIKQQLLARIIHDV